MILRLTRFLSALAATLTCISGWTWMSGISCVSTASSASSLEVTVTIFTREQIQEMLRRTENDAEVAWNAMQRKIEYWGKLQRDIGAMNMELELMDEQSKMPGDSGGLPTVPHQG